MSRLPPQAYLQECFDYDPLTGMLTWKERPRHHFRRDQDHQAFNSRYAGNEAFTANLKGYRVGRLQLAGKARNFLAHLVIWKLVYGRDPIGDIDHRDTVRHHNGIDNLREGSRSQNLANSSARVSNTGFKGVSRNGTRFMAKVTKDRKQIYLGTFDTAAEASVAYRQAAINLHGEFARA